MSAADAVGLALTGLAFTLLMLAGLLRAAARPTPTIAPPARVSSSPPVPTGAKNGGPVVAPTPTMSRERQLCVQRGHVYADWARTPTHHLCVRCGDQVARLADDFDAHTDHALAIANSEPDPGDEVAVADLALWELENDWATP